MDPELGSVYLPVEDPTNDDYGGARPGNDLFGDSLVCVDLTTGKMKWYYQIVHHPIWDYDMSSPPLLVDITVDGKPIKAVAVPSKQAFLYVFDRVTGKPIWPIVEKPVPQSDVPGEKTSKTQPFPTKPAPYARQRHHHGRLIDFTPELHAKAVEIIKKLQDGSDVHARRGQQGRRALSPRSTSATLGGGTNWPGAGFNPETHMVFAPAANAGVVAHGIGRAAAGLVRQAISGRHGRPAVPGQWRPRLRLGLGRAQGQRDQAKLNAILAKAHPEASRSRGRRPGRQRGRPAAASSRPMALLTAINLDTGDLCWQVPHGDTPDEIRNNPALKGLNIPKTGQNGNVGWWSPRIW